MTGTIAEGYVALEDKGGFTIFVVAFGIVFFIWGVGFETIWGGAGRAFEDFGVGVAQPDCYISDPFLSEFNCVDSRYGPDDCRFAVGNMTDSSNIEGGLPTHDLRGIGGQFWDILVELRFEFSVLGV